MTDQVLGPLLDAEELRAAICRLADAGYGDHTIAAAGALAVEQVRSILGARAAGRHGCGRG
jgi:hypothetical protein